MCALVLALRKVPIYPPGGGGLALGDPGNPTYSVAVSDEMAAAAREKFASAENERRLFPVRPPSPTPTPETDTTLHKVKSSGQSSSGVATIVPTSETMAAEALNAVRPEDFTQDVDHDEVNIVGSPDIVPEMKGNSTATGVNLGLQPTPSTCGRRRAGTSAPSVASLSIQQPSEDLQSARTRSRGSHFDQEAQVMR